MKEDLEEDQDLFKTPLVDEVGKPDRFRVISQDVGDNFPVLGLEFVRHIPNGFHSLFRPTLGFDSIEFLKGVPPLFGFSVCVWETPLENEVGGFFPVVQVRRGG